MFNFMTLLESIIISNDGGAAATEAAKAAGETASQSGGFLGGFGSAGILIYVVLLGALYFFLIRPQKKREKEVKEMQAGLKVGDNIVTSSGMFGTIVGVGEDCFVVEFGTNKGVRIPVRKVDILGIKTPNMTAVRENNE